MTRWIARLVPLTLAVACLAVPSRAAALPATTAHHLWDRSTQTDAQGFYQLPAGICDDFEVTDLTPAIKAQIASDFQTMHAIGAHEMRLGMSWLRIQTGPNTYDWAFWDYLVDQARKSGIRLMPYVCYTPEWLGDGTPEYWHRPPRDLGALARFMRVVVARYKDRGISSWELWNEPDNFMYWQNETVTQGPDQHPIPSADKFAAMILPAIKAVRETDPSAGVILGGMAGGRGPFFDRLMTTYRIGTLVDAINVHSYLRTWDERPVEDLHDRVIPAMEAMIRQTGGAHPPALFLDEFGYSSHRFSPTSASAWGGRIHFAYEHTPAYQAEELFKDHVMALATGQVSYMGWYRLRDLDPAQGVIGDDNNRYLGVVDVHGKPKPAFKAFALYQRLLGHPVRSLDGTLKLTRSGHAEARVHAFERQDGHVIVVGWLQDLRPGTWPAGDGQAADPRRETISLRLPGRRFTGMRQLDAEGTLLASPVRFRPDGVEGVVLHGSHVWIAELLPDIR